MNRADVTAATGTIGAISAAALTTLTNNPGLQTFISVLATAISTWLIQSRLQAWQERNRALAEHEKEMKEHVYGPLLRHINTLLEDLESPASEYRTSVGRGQEPIWMDGMTEVMKDYHFSLANPRVINQTSQMHMDLQHYLRSEKIVHSITVQMENKVASEMLTELSQRGDTTILYRMFYAGGYLGAISLQEALSINMTPVEVLNSRYCSTSGDAEIHVSVGGYPPTNGQILEERCNQAFEQIRKDPFVVSRNTQRDRIIALAKDERTTLHDYLKPGAHGPSDSKKR